MNIKGLKITDIMNMSWDELNSMNATDLKQVTSRLVSASNKRIKRLTETKRGKSSFAYQSVEERGRKFSVRGMDTNQLKSEFASAKHFLEMKTSTLKGWNKYRTEMETRVGYATEGESQNWSERTWSKYWKVYRRFEETHGGELQKGGKGKKGDSDRVQRMLTEIMKNNDKRKNAESFQRIIEDEWKDMQEQSKLAEQKVSDQFDIKGTKID